MSTSICMDVTAVDIDMLGQEVCMEGIQIEG